MRRLWRSVAFRLAVGYGALAIGSMAVVAAVFYFGTVGVLERGTDAKLESVAQRLSDHFVRRGGADALHREIAQLLADGVDQDTEVYLLLDRNGAKIVGNIEGWTPSATGLGQLQDRRITRDGRPSISRLLPLRLSDGETLIVGRDMRDRFEIEQIVWRALAVGGICAALLAALGAAAFRRRLEARIAAIHRTAREVEAGDLRRRVPVADANDEFARLGRDINRMLDEIEQLMDGVKHVSNAIAHDLRTPLGRIRGQLDEALRPGRAAPRLAETAASAIVQIDDLIGVLDRLLQIAEAESGTRRQSFAIVLLEPVIATVVELYDAQAEENGIALISEVDGAADTLGDRNLLASAIANLVDNALKYAGEGATVRVGAARQGDAVRIVVDDNGPGIAAADRDRVVERFYRGDASRAAVAGNGLGLSIVNSIAVLHWGSLQLEDAAPGLRATLVLPRAESRRGRRSSSSGDERRPLAAE